MIQCRRAAGFYTRAMSDIERLLKIMARLRDPDGGCPWDLVQDFASISPHTIEEAYEVDEAIASGDLEALRDELGDLLFQVVFQSRLAEEQGAFDFAGVVDAIVDKLVRRHPHVFAQADTPESVEGQRANWEEIKAAERASAGGQGDAPNDPFAGIPRSLPALARSEKIAGRIERLPGRAPGSTDASDATDAALRALDEIAMRGREARTMLAESDSPVARTTASDHVARRERHRALIGAGLVAWVKLARALEIDPEQALRSADDAAVSSIRAHQHQATHAQVR
jgi:ATP diphosphatase